MTKSGGTIPPASNSWEGTCPPVPPVIYAYDWLIYCIHLVVSLYCIAFFIALYNFLYSFITHVVVNLCD